MLHSVPIGGTPLIVYVLSRWFRRLPRAYLRAGAVLSGLVALACLPPSTALPPLVAIASALMRAWFYFCSMMMGAAPFLAVGAVAAAALTHVLPRIRACAAPRARSLAVMMFALLFPGCDCSMNAYAPALRAVHPGYAGFAIVWGSCCNLLALASTAVILGPHMLESRVAAGTIAAALTALAWRRLQVDHGVFCPRPQRFVESFTHLAGGGVASFAVAACFGAAYLAWFTGFERLGSPALAAAIGAVVSPCSSADALLARVLFKAPASQLAFMVAAQCFDVRQIAIAKRCFGWRHVLAQTGAAAAGCAVGCLLAG